MKYTATTTSAAITLSAADLYSAHIARGHAAAMRAVRRAVIRAAVKADPSVMQGVHAAMREAMVTPVQDARARSMEDLLGVMQTAPLPQEARSAASKERAAIMAAFRAAVNAAGRAALAAAVRVAPATLNTDGKPYAPGMIRAALQVARKVLARACEHGGTDTQRTALQELDRVNATAVRYDTALYSWEASAPAVLGALAAVGHDAQDMYAAAMAGIVGGYTFPKGAHKGERLGGVSDNGSSPREHIRAAYLTANASMNAQRSATVRELSTDYVREQGGDLVAIGTAIARIITADERWTLSDVAPEARVAIETIREHLPRALALCRPVQREIAALLARGCSVAQIADKTGRDRRTVQRNIAIMRGTCAAYIREHAPELLPMVKAAGYDAFDTAQTAADSNKHRTEAAQARKKAANAEYCKAYRERKRAAAAAAAQTAAK